MTSLYYNGYTTTILFHESDSAAERIDAVKRAFNIPQTSSITFIDTSEAVAIIVSPKGLQRRNLQYNVIEDSSPTFSPMPVSLVINPRAQKTIASLQLAAEPSLEISSSGTYLNLSIRASWSLASKEGFNDKIPMYFIHSFEMEVPVFDVRDSVEWVPVSHFPGEEGSTITKGITSGILADAKLNIAASPSATAGIGFSKSKSATHSPVTLFQTSYEYWPEGSSNTRIPAWFSIQPAIINHHLFSNTVNFYTPPDPNPSPMNLLCEQVHFANFKCLHRWQVEMRHFTNGKLFSWDSDKLFKNKHIPLEAFNAKSQEFSIKGKIAGANQIVSGNFATVISACIEGRESERESGDKFNISQLIYLLLRVDNGRVSISNAKAWRRLKTGPIGSSLL